MRPRSSPRRWWTRARPLFGMNVGGIPLAAHRHGFGMVVAPLNLTGSYADGTLTFRGERTQPDGTRLLHRLSLHANPDRTVRQFWEVSSDGGGTWTSSFDGLYRKRKG